MARLPYRFGSFVLDASERRLTADGKEIPLPDKVFETLLVLARNAGRLVTKEELMSAVWPDTVVEENNLSHNISVIRRALGNPDWIQTVPRRGFRFNPPAAPVPGEGRKTWTLALAALVVVAAAALPLGSHRHQDAPAPARSVSVIPFRNLNATGDREYIAAGLSETLTNRLATIPNLAVRPARKDDQDPLTAGLRLGVDAVVTGSVQAHGETMRVTSELLDVRSRAIVWSRSFDFTGDEILIIEDALASDIGQRIRPGLTAEQRAMLTPPHSRDRVANDEYLRGRELLESRRSLAQAILHFERALARDREFALAWAGLAEALTHPLPNTSPAVLDRAMDAAKRAVRLDPMLAEAHATVGFISLFYRWDWSAAERELRLALRLKPGSARIHDWYAIALLTRGDKAGATREIHRAHEIDTQSPDIASDVALVYLQAHDFVEAERAARVALALDPSAQARGYLIDALLRQKKTEEALAQLASLDVSPTRLRLVREIATTNDRAQLTREIRASEETLSKSENPDAIAMLYASAGDHENALRWLDRAYRDHAFGLIFANLAPAYDPLRDDPRFQDLMRRVGLIELPRG